MRKTMIVAALAAAASPAVAQNVNVGGGLVDVTVQDVNVLNDSLNDNQIEILNNNNVAVPINVQVPIGIAANVCGIAANVLAADLKQDGKAECTATSGSSALGQQILRQKVRQNRYPSRLSERARAGAAFAAPARFFGTTPAPAQLA
jgi:hypothetical protein